MSAYMTYEIQGMSGQRPVSVLVRMRAKPLPDTAWQFLQEFYPNAILVGVRIPAAHEYDARTRSDLKTVKIMPLRSQRR